MICLGSISSLSHSRLDFLGAVAADLRVALLQIPSVPVVIALELGVVWVRRVVREVLRQGLGKQMLVLQACLAEWVVLRRRGIRLWCGILNGSSFSFCSDGRIGDLAILPLSVTRFAPRCCPLSHTWSKKLVASQCEHRKSRIAPSNFTPDLLPQ